jgi:hypothetical protein
MSRSWYSGMVWCCLGIWLVSLAMLRAGTPGSAAAQTPSTSEDFTFVALGDMPYSTPEVDRHEQFLRLIAAINRVQPAFSIHVGDFKSGSTLCDDATFTKIHALFMTFEQPLVYTPGDNEWTDCHRKNNGPFDPLERLEKIRTMFFPTAVSLGKNTLPVTRQSDVSAFKTMVENARWVKNGILFVTVHVIGSNNNLRQNRDAALEFLARNQANIAWINEAFNAAKTEQVRGIVLAMQADPGFKLRHGDGSGFQETLEALSKNAADFGKPVLLVHGDSHEFIIDQPLRHPDGKKLLDNVVRLEVFGEKQVHAVRVFVRVQDPMLFAFQPLFVPENMESLQR